MHGSAQPHAYHVINRYFTNYFPKAADLADKARAANASDPYIWMTQTWIIDLFLNCKRSNYVSDPRYGNHQLLQCPNASAVEKFKRAVKLGDIVWHAAATDQEAGYFPNAGLFEASLVLNERIAKELGVNRSTSVSTRDVPGWTRAAIPLLAKHGINGMSFGSGTPPGRADVPPIFVWRDVQSQKEVVATWESGYGGWGQLFTLPNGVALAAAWTGDNSGPSFGNALAKLREENPGAHVHFSTFSRFFDEANKPENKAGLPVVTGEIGDAWIYGVPSDPLKNQQFREMGRARDECINSGGCNVESDAMKDFDRLLVKLPEHTWGLAQSWFTADYQNYTNVQFQAALKDSIAHGPLVNQTDNRGGAAEWRADYFTTVQSWYEQRSFITNAVGAIAIAEAEAEAGAEPGAGAGQRLGVPKGWAAELRARLSALSEVVEPTASSLQTAGYSKVALGEHGTGVLQCGGAEVGLDLSGAIVHLVNKNTNKNSNAPGVSWANSSRPIGQFLYQTFDDADYQKFLGPAPSGFHMPQCKPGNVSPICGNFNRPNMTAANPQHVEATATATSVWQRTSDEGCEFAVEAAMEERLHTLAGAPSLVWTLFEIRSTAATEGKPSIAVDMEVRMFNKTATRLPESIFVVFRPAFEISHSARARATASFGADTAYSTERKFTARELEQQRIQREQLGHGWRLQMFNESNSTLDPTDVLVQGHGSGGAPHTRCISGVVRDGARHGQVTNTAPRSAHAADGVFTLSSADVPCVSTGEPSPFPTPIDGVPDMAMGVAYNVFNNIW
jgi:hypothetical protein